MERCFHGMKMIIFERLLKLGKIQAQPNISSGPIIQGNCSFFEERSFCTRLQHLRPQFFQWANSHAVAILF